MIWKPSPLKSLAALLAASCLPLAAAPVFIPLGTGVTVTAVSADGRTVVGSRDNVPFFWTAENGITELPGLGKASGVSADGSVIVGTAGIRGGRWEGGVYTQLNGVNGTPFPFVAKNVEANGVTADGSVVVGSSTTPTSFQAAISETAGFPTLLGNLGSPPVVPPNPPVSPISRAIAISGNGSTIVGQSSSPQGTQAFVVRNGTMTGLGDVAGGTFYSSANAVSADGSVIVGMGTGGTAILPVSSALRWVQNTMSVLPLPVGMNNGTAKGISGDARIIVGSGQVDNVPTAVTWQGAGSQNLGTLMAEKGVSTGGLYLAEAVASSGDGDVIVGNSHNSRNGWIITGALGLFGLAPPEPQLNIVKVGSTVNLSFATEPGFVYLVQKSTNLQQISWAPLGNIHSTAGAAGPATHQVTDALATSPRAFYRLYVESAN